jgi:hypothetical protein
LTPPTHALVLTHFADLFTDTFTDTFGTLTPGPEAHALTITDTKPRLT